MQLHLALRSVTRAANWTNLEGADIYRGDVASVIKAVDELAINIPDVTVITNQ